VSANITLELDRTRHEIVVESLACFAVKERRQAAEEAEPQAEERRARAAEADCIRQLIGLQSSGRSEVDHGARVELEPDRWFVLTESLELWADLHELGAGIDGSVATARDLVDDLDRQLAGQDRRRMQQQHSYRLVPR
jgi:hypothetical protein